MWMAVTLNSKWLPPNIKSWAPLTSVDFKVLPQHDLLVRRGHRYHCHSESSPPHCFCFPFRHTDLTLKISTRTLGYTSVHNNALSWYYQESDTNVPNRVYGHKPDFLAAAAAAAEVTATGPTKAPNTQWYICEIRSFQLRLLFQGPRGNYGSWRFRCINEEWMRFVGLRSPLFSS